MSKGLISLRIHAASIPIAGLAIALVLAGRLADNITTIVGLAQGFHEGGDPLLIAAIKMAGQPGVLFVMAIEMPVYLGILALAFRFSPRYALLMAGYLFALGVSAAFGNFLVIAGLV